MYVPALTPVIGIEIVTCEPGGPDGGLSVTRDGAMKL